MDEPRIEAENYLPPPFLYRVMTFSSFAILMLIRLKLMSNDITEGKPISPIYELSMCASNIFAMLSCLVDDHMQAHKLLYLSIGIMILARLFRTHPAAEYDDTTPTLRIII